ncbi:MAG: fructosamine kinase family protein [Bacteroidota bacterium]
MAIPLDIQEELSSLLGYPTKHAHSLSGGCIHQAYRVDTDRGPIFIKFNRLNQASNFTAEAKGLSLLRQSQTLSVPNILHQGATKTHAFLALEHIESGQSAPDFWETLGTGLARLHQQTAAQFGLDHDNFIGALPQLNDWQSSWAEFYASMRILPMLRMGRQRGYINQDLSTAVEKMLIKRPDFFPPEPPALLHGDLWGGNLLTGPRGQAWLIDPAVYYGHREMELAFMTMFDRQSPEFYAAYEATYPLVSGYAERFAYQQLYPLLVHVNLFGTSYLSGVQAILRRFG